jgi:hypothetical protein
LQVDIPLDPGRAIAGKVVGPDGKPVAGVMIAGLTGFPQAYTALSGDAFTVLAVFQDENRTVMAFHRNKKLAGTIVVRGSDKELVVLRLCGWGAVTGRIVNKDGVPVAGAAVRLWYKRQPAAPLNTLLIRGDPAKTDAAGRFRIDIPYPGIEFTLIARRETVSGRHLVSVGTVKAGQTKALDDIVLKEEE